MYIYIYINLYRYIYIYTERESQSGACARRASCLRHHQPTSLEKPPDLDPFLMT